MRNQARNHSPLDSAFESVQFGWVKCTSLWNIHRLHEAEHTQLEGKLTLRQSDMWTLISFPSVDKDLGKPVTVCMNVANGTEWDYLIQSETQCFSDETAGCKIKVLMYLWWLLSTGWKRLLGYLNSLLIRINRQGKHDQVWWGYVKAGCCISWGNHCRDSESLSLFFFF